MSTVAEQTTGRVEPEDREEIRFAIVMTGGVSLAVWMGGVAQELGRVTRHEGVYGELLDLSGSEARVDVISGTSAGGLNGALLALAIARCRPLDGLKQLWFDRAGMSELFRSPLERDPPSLMKGDDYFLPSLVDAFRRLDASNCNGGDPVPGPLTLLITTSVLKGSITRHLDQLGTEIADIDHRALFRFRRGDTEHHLPEARDPGESGLTCIHAAARAARDDFADPDIHLRLALAARCSASFPFAFEPSLCPVGLSTDRPPRPDMRCHIRVPASRFTVDGGVLVNKPIRPAVRAIYEQPAGRQVRRVLAYVVPDPGSGSQPEADEAKSMPALARTIISSLVTLPRNESVEAELTEIQDRNARARAQRDRRARWLEEGSLEDRAKRLFEEYRRLRAESSAEQIVGAIERGLIRSDVEVRIPYRDRLKRTLLDVRADYLPDAFPAAGWEPTADTWAWGLQPVENAALAVLDLLKRGMSLVLPGAGRDAQASTDASTIRIQRERLHAYLDMYRSQVQALDKDFWRQMARDALEAVASAERGIPGTTPDPVAIWARDAFEGSTLDPATVVDIARNIAQILLMATGPLRRLVANAQSDAEASSTTKGEAVVLAAMVDALVPDPLPQDPREDAAVNSGLRRLLALDVVQTVLTPHEPVIEQEVELVQISAETPNALGAVLRPEDKVAGIQMGHFGAFYKRSWRANDWMWGRLDGCYRLTQILLNPYRLRQRRLSIKQVADVVERLAQGDGATRKVLTGPGSTWNRGAVERELRFLGDSSLPLPTRLDACWEAVARRIQLDIAREELRDVAGAVDHDLASGGSANGAAVTFRNEVVRLGGTGPLDPEAAMYLFPRCRVGSEKIAGETRSDLFAETIGTSAAVTVSAVGGARSGVPAPLRAMLGWLRGFALVTWVLIKSAVEGSRAGTAAVSGMLAAGGVLVSLAVLVDNPPALVVTVGAVVLVAGFTVAALRAGTPSALLAILIGIAIAVAPFIAIQLEGPLDGYRGTWWADGLLWLGENRDRLRAVFLVAGLVLGAVLLGLLGRRRRTAR